MFVPVEVNLDETGEEQVQVSFPGQIVHAKQAADRDRAVLLGGRDRGRQSDRQRQGGGPSEEFQLSHRIAPFEPVCDRMQMQTAVLRGARQQRRGAGVAAEGLLAGETSSVGFFQSDNLFGRPRERRRTSRMLLTPSSASAPAAGSGTIVGMTATKPS